ncbi:hypothetical protein SERLA73DRAFT_169351 [Serpula lacrymans var. lacrymans S7.3]|uniref:Uncharacterized protein n=2 Tax=Serpula lacrymans var. lacrymans TaxID=341189 RepID=F8PZQ5_SERL3|nr:uncharacterized protein SERLADRAFT_450230 [Serpula lacrymans var. lacrymans S7.9]EGN98377.1 hypothetical protein SERLA73DRAFT_169351 [Serpula lacrymans var. lacrymans S7.3]EGO23930.1 hypothetical protein SERLADRAFT_450230 [Serpula lacrymans var. lacrymans S7.9]
MLEPNGIPLDSAAVASTVLEAILYGFSVLMFIGTMWALIHRRGMIEMNKKMVAVANLLLFFSTTHLIIDIVRTEEGLVQYRDTFPKGPVAFFSDVAQWSFVYKNMVYMLQTLVGDAVVIYRCFVVWQSLYIIALPILLWCSVALTGIGCVYSISQATVNKENIFAPGTGPWITAFLASTLAANLLSTSLLAYRIWDVTREVGDARVGRSSLWPILRIILDSGILYSVSLLAALLCFVTKNRGHYVLLDMIMPIISITFYMVIIRVTIKRTTSQDMQATTRLTRGFSTNRQSIPERQHYPLKPLQVHITQLTETNDGDGDIFKSVSNAEDIGSSKTAASVSDVAIYT